jgi:hypothetical protein
MLVVYLVGGALLLFVVLALLAAYLDRGNEDDDDDTPTDDRGFPHILPALLAAVLACSGVALADSTPREKALPHKAAPEATDLDGYYICRGKETGGKSYTGIVAIAKRGDVYVLQWNCAGMNFVGIGMRQGDTLSASWTMPNDAKGVIRGVNMYRIEPGRKLVGRWATLPGNGRCNEETLTFLAVMPKEEE